MKTLISAVALATILSTPAMANKVYVGDKPTMSECEIKQDIMLQQMIYEIDNMIMMLEEKRMALLQEYPKPVDGEKSE